MTTAQAAEAIGCSQQHVRKLALDGKIAGQKITDRLYLLDVESVHAYAARPPTAYGWKRGRPRG